jgi:hypothetical protein
MIMGFIVGQYGYTLHEWRNEKHGGDLEKVFGGGFVCLACCNIPHALRRKAITRTEYSIGVRTSCLMCLVCRATTCVIVRDACRREASMGRHPGACACNRHSTRTFPIWEFSSS